MPRDWIIAATRGSTRHGSSTVCQHARPRRISLGPVKTALALLALATGSTLAQDGSTAGPPAPAPPPTAAVGGWSAWAPVPNTGLTFLSPSLASNAAGDAVDMVSVGLDLGVDYSRLSAGVWSAPIATGRQTFLPAVVVSGVGGVPQLFVTGGDGQVSQSAGGAGNAPVATGAATFLPPAAALNIAGNSLELVTVGPDGAVRHSRLLGGVWSSPAPLNAISLLPPTLVANPAGGLELAIIGLDRQVYHARFTGVQWSAFQPTGVFSELAPALAVGSDGVVHLAATGLDRAVAYSRLTGNVWSAAAPTGLQSSLSPALVVIGGTVELLARGLDRVVQHGRLVSGAWTAPQPLGITTEARPALVAAGPNLEAAIAGTDGLVYASHFVAAPAAPVVSFSKDIVPRIFKAYGCNGCHGGSGGLTLGNQAFANIVNKASNERPALARVKPGDADNSYLLRKMAGGPDIGGGRMPLGGRAVSAADLDLMRQWINAGAPNN